MLLSLDCDGQSRCYIYATLNSQSRDYAVVCVCVTI